MQHQRPPIRRPRTSRPTPRGDARSTRWASVRSCRRQDSRRSPQCVNVSSCRREPAGTAARNTRWATVRSRRRQDDGSTPQCVNVSSCRREPAGTAARNTRWATVRSRRRQDDGSTPQCVNVSSSRREPAGQRLGTHTGRPCAPAVARTAEGVHSASTCAPAVVDSTAGAHADGFCGPGRRCDDGPHTWGCHVCAATVPRRQFRGHGDVKRGPLPAPTTARGHGKRGAVPGRRLPGRRRLADAAPDGFRSQGAERQPYFSRGNSLPKGA
jgi:hypothetical protein